MQGRVEPGNVGVMQLAPTVQSTQANYRQFHGGRQTPLVEWFTRPRAGTRLCDVMQSEEGSRYYGKYNHNIVHEIPEGTELELPDTFRWFDVPALSQLASASNVVNTDLRSVLACVDWDLLSTGDGPFAGHSTHGFGAALRMSYHADDDRSCRTFAEIVQWLEMLRLRCALETRVIPLHALRNWSVDDDAVRERTVECGFVARQFAVVAEGREVSSWNQPLIDSRSRGRVILVSQQRGDVLQFLLKASHEIGFLEGVQISSSACVPPGQTDLGDDLIEDELTRRIDDLDGVTVHLECCQFEEGGRFFRDENLYQIVELAPHVTLPPSDDYCWATFRQIRRLIRTRGALAIELRAVLTLLLSYS